MMNERNGAKKLYKAHKVWFAAGVAAIGLFSAGALGSNSVSAATTGTEPTTTQVKAGSTATVTQTKADSASASAQSAADQANSSFNDFQQQQETKANEAAAEKNNTRFGGATVSDPSMKTNTSFNDFQ
ncbi:KxYKxGKxW signal peptide domain-containing protein, partial [Lacticaseibacillus thailandensis]